MLLLSSVKKHVDEGRFGMLAIRTLAILLVIGAFAWMAFDIRWHYHMESICFNKSGARADCKESWHWLPFVMGAFSLLFAAGVFNQKVAKGAADIVLPFTEVVMKRLGRRDTDPVVAVTEETPTEGPPVPGSKETMP